MLRLFVPPTPSSDEAREVAERELAKSKYDTDPSFLDRFQSNIIDRIYQALDDLTGSGNASILILVIAVITVVLIVVALTRVQRRAVRSGVSMRHIAAPVFDDERSSAELFASADAAQNRGDYNLCIVERFRGIIRLLDEKSLLTVFPGLTAGEAARSGSSAIQPAGDLLLTAELFDAIYYGDGSASLDDCLRASRVVDQARAAKADRSKVKNELVAQ